MDKTRYRIRRGWWGKCILQKEINSPSLIGNQVDSNIRRFSWVDCNYDHSRVTNFHLTPEVINEIT